MRLRSSCPIMEIKAWDLTPWWRLLTTQFFVLQMRIAWRQSTCGCDMATINTEKNDKTFQSFFSYQSAFHTICMFPYECNPKRAKYRAPIDLESAAPTDYCSISALVCCQSIQDFLQI